MAEFRENLSDFTANFSSHGFQRVFYPIGKKPTKVSKWFRLIWLFAWGSAAVAMMCQMGQIFQQYFEYGKATTVSITREQSFPFPAVTICSENSLVKNRLSDWLEDCHTMGPYEGICDHAQKLQRKNLSGDPLTTYYKRMLPANLNSKYVTDDWQFLQNLSHSLGDVRGERWMFLDLADISKNITITKDSLWKFNGYLYAKIGSFQETPGSCFTFNHQSQDNLVANGESILYIPLKKGLMQKESSESHSDTTNSLLCYFVMIHAPGTIPVLDDAEKICSSTEVIFELE